jgi:hypothetical protein
MIIFACKACKPGVDYVLFEKEGDQASILESSQLKASGDAGDQLHDFKESVATLLRDYRVEQVLVNASVRGGGPHAKSPTPEKVKNEAMVQLAAHQEGMPCELLKANAVSRKAKLGGLVVVGQRKHKSRCEMGELLLLAWDGSNA